MPMKEWKVSKCFLLCSFEFSLGECFRSEEKHDILSSFNSSVSVEQDQFCLDQLYSVLGQGEIGFSFSVPKILCCT